MKFKLFLNLFHDSKYFLVFIGRTGNLDAYRHACASFHYFFAFSIHSVVVYPTIGHLIRAHLCNWNHSGWEVKVVEYHTVTGL